MELLVNGRRRSTSSDPERPLLYVLREEFDLTGAKYGCGEGQCGACTVLLDGAPVRSCRTPARLAQGKQITTIEGLEHDGQLHPLQEAFIQADAMQCGYCTPGMILSAAGLLRKTPHPDETEIKRPCRAISAAAELIHELFKRSGWPQGRELHMLEPLEVERYELFAGPAYRFTPDRRDFLKILGGGILVLLALDPSETEAQESGGRRRGGGGDVPQNLGAWLHIRPDGGITVFTGKVEVGQNARTSLTSVVAEELRLDRSRIEMVMADTQLTPYDMGTVGSMTTPRMVPQIQKVAAVAREMLVDLAAQQWKTERNRLVVEDGTVRNPGSGQKLAFAELSKGQELTRTILSSTLVTPASDWKVLGHDVTKVNARDMVTGRHRYTHDLVRPGMLYGRIVRAPAFGAKLQSVDSSAVEKMPGITVVQSAIFWAWPAPIRPSLRQRLR